MPSQLIALRAMTQFRCIGGDCEDDCCHGWSIHVDKGQFDRIRETLGPAGKNRFKSSISWNTDDGLGSITMRRNGDCPFLNMERLCHLHGRYGAEILPVSCAMFPRAVSQNDDCLELSGSLGCPEFARKLLLDPEGARLTEADRELIPVASVPFHNVATKKKSSYHAALDPIRALCLDLLAIPDISLRSRLFFVARFAHTITPFFNAGERNHDDAKLDEEMRRMSNARFLGELTNEFEKLPTRGDWALPMIQTMLVARSALGRSPLNALLADIWKTNELAHGVSSEEASENKGKRYSPSSLLETYHAMRSTLEEKERERIETCFENFSRHYFFTHWYTASKNLLLHTLKLLVSITIIRFLLYSHPALVTRVIIKGGEVDRELLDRCAVEVFYLYGKGIAHAAEFRQRIHESVEEQKMTTLPHAVALIQF